MSISAFFGSRILLVPNCSSTRIGGANQGAPRIGGGVNNVGLVIECSSRPQKKATAHHKKTRPRKTQPWDIKRKPTVYSPLPPLPPDFTIVAADGEEAVVAPPST